MKKIINISFLIFLVLILPALLISCQGVDKAKKSLVTITIGSDKTVSIKSNESVLMAMARKALSALFSPRIANAQIPSIVSDLRVTVSAPDMASISKTVNVAGLDSVSITIEAPNGSGRTFFAEGLNAAGVTAYQGQATSDLFGAPISLTITLAAVSIPTVASTSPVDGAVDVVINTTVNATFSEAMDPATITPSTFLLVQGDGVTSVTGTVSLNGTTATFTPDADLATNETFTATITTGAKSLIGFPLAQDYIWSFTTGYLPDKAAPAFSGLASVTNASIKSMTLSWSAATDEVTSSSNIVYLIYRAETSGGEIYSSATYTTSPGVTSYTATGLTPGTKYFFVVRAKDEAGNIDLNTVEKFSAYPGLHVNAATGDDTTGDGTQAKPYLSISKALAVTTGNEGIFVAAGKYSETDTNETPLQLKPGTIFACVGADYSTVINVDFTVTGIAGIIGATGAMIDGCKIVLSPGVISTAIDDDAFPITVTNCLLENTTFSAQAGIKVASDSVISNNTISAFTFDGSSCGILVSSGTPTISSNTIALSDNGIKISTGNAVISNNTITANSNRGLDVISGNPMITSNIITWNSDGIYVSNGSPSISGNDIHKNMNGIYYFSGNSQITGNTIYSNATGILVASSTANPVINNNSIYCNISEDLNAFNAITVIDATNNSWDNYGPTLSTTCGSGVDICYSAFSLPTYSPYNSAVPVSGGCP